MEKKDYVLLKDIRIELRRKDDDVVDEEAKNGCLTLCFWLYIDSCASFPSIILHQNDPEVMSYVPFLWLNQKKQLMLAAPLFLHQDSPGPDKSFSWTQQPCASSDLEFPMKKWVHIGCEIRLDLVRLHIDGKIVGDKPLACFVNEDSHPDSLQRVSMTLVEGNVNGLQACVHGMDVLSPTFPVTDHYLKDPPIHISIDYSSTCGIDCNDVVWSIIGGKASSRRIFSVDVVLFDAFVCPVNRDLEVVASLIYSDTEVPVENADDDEPPLLICCDGIEFPSHDRPCKLVNSRASFKLKISQLSSKCNNKLFRIRFSIPKLGSCPFLETLSPSILCVSRKCQTPAVSQPWRKASPGIYLLSGSQSQDTEDEPAEILPDIVREAKPSPSSKRIKLGNDKPFAMFTSDQQTSLARGESRPCTVVGNKENNGHGIDTNKRSESHDRMGGLSSASDSSEASSDQDMLSSSNPVSDLMVFKYCLGGPAERSQLLKEIAMSANQNGLAEFAKKVSLYSGCPHHRHQINIGKRLVEEGILVWASLSKNNRHVLWENLVVGVNQHFLRIASCTRPLTFQDFECLRKIAGCRDLVSQEKFEKMWCWLYPVAYSLSQTAVKSIWDSLSPKWIEGFITKEEAEHMLHGPGGIQDPGTFVLRFPTSRRWPHPDAGNLVVTYIGSDYNIHHRLLSLEFISSSAGEESRRPLQDILLEEPELSRLGRQDI